MYRKFILFALPLSFLMITACGKKSEVAEETLTEDPAIEVEEVKPISEGSEPGGEEVPALADGPNAELNEILGFLTALRGGVASLQVDEAGVAEIAGGVHKMLTGELELSAIPQTAMETALSEVQLRAEAAEAGAAELPAFSEGSLTNIGAFIFLRSGIQQLGFGAAEADAIKAGFIAGSTAEGVPEEMQSKLPAFQAMIAERMEAAQGRMQEAEKAMLAQQAAAQKAAMAEFQSIADEWSAKGNMTVVLETNQGDIEIELYPSAAPLAVANFVGHIESGYYDGLIFHRVIEGFMIQGGDPLGTGTGGQSIWGKSFPDEFTEELRFDQKGLLAMANSGPMTNGSQFFITTENENPQPGQPPHPVWLNDRHTIFGKVVAGYDNVVKIEKVETGAQDKPVEDQKILKAYVK